MNDASYSQPTTSPTSNMAIVSLVCGILSWFLFPFIGAIIAIVTGHMARSEIKKSQGTIAGDGLALAGLILGYAHLVFFCASIVIFFLFFGSIVGLAGCAALSETARLLIPDSIALTP